MANRVIIGLMVLAALVEGVLPGAVPQNLLPFALVVLGLVWGWMGVDAENPTAYLAVAIAAGLAAESDALTNIPAIGGALDGILGQASTALYAGVLSVLVGRAWNRIKG